MPLILVQLTVKEGEADICGGAARSLLGHGHTRRDDSYQAVSGSDIGCPTPSVPVLDSGIGSARPRNQRRYPAFVVQSVLRLWFIAIDFALLCQSLRGLGRQSHLMISLRSLPVCSYALAALDLQYQGMLYYEAISAVLALLQLFCEGQYKPLQDVLSGQVFTLETLSLYWAVTFSHSFVLSGYDFFLMCLELYGVAISHGSVHRAMLPFGTVRFQCDTVWYRAVTRRLASKCQWTF
eukprot:969589-Rhodomonas_salina.4